MAFIISEDGESFSLNKPFMTFLFIACAVGIGMIAFVLILYGIIHAATSSGFSELQSVTDTNDRERIDDNDDLEDV